jgi:transcriptional regulator with XRE-family HTH domain
MADNRDELRLFGQAIREEREERDLSADALAAAASIEAAQLASLEAGQLDPDFALLVQLAGALHTRVSAFVLRAERLSRND